MATQQITLVGHKARVQPGGWSDERMQRALRVAIMGAGIGGLTAALALLRRGFDVSVHEQSSALREIGAGLNLSPNAMKAFRALQIEDDVVRIGFEADCQVIRSWNSGRVIMRQPRKQVLSERYGAGYYTVHRADLLEVLIRAIPASALQVGARCVAVQTDADTASATFADGSEVEADIVIGADGIHSAVRASLFGLETPHFTGCVCWRGLVPVEAVPGGLSTTDSTMWLGPHGHVVHYLVRGGDLVNFVAHYETDSWTEESWTRECDRAEVLETYRGWHESLIRLFESSDRYYKWALYDRDPLGHWSKGRATLVGDSAHAMLPYLAQGACMAIEDGCVLAATLARMSQEPVAALQCYEQIRLPRARRAVLGSRERAVSNHLSSRWGALRRDVAYALRSRFGAEKISAGSSWLYDYDVGAEETLFNN